MKRGHFASARLFLLTAALASGFSIAAKAQLISYSFDQGSGSATNSGSTGNTADLTFGSAAGWGGPGSGVNGSNSYAGTNSNPTSSNSYAATPGNVGALNGLTQMTITGWINTSNWDGGGPRYILGNYTGSWSNGFWLATDRQDGSAEGQLSLNLGNNNDAQSTGGHFDDFAGEWMFFAASWNGNGGGQGTISYYYGTQTLSTQLDSTVNDNGLNSTGNATGQLYVGNNSNGSPWYTAIGGGLDDIRIYDSALDATQIEAIRSSALVPETGTAVMALAAFAGFLSSARRRRRTAL